MKKGIHIFDGIRVSPLVIGATLTLLATFYTYVPLSRTADRVLRASNEDLLFGTPQESLAIDVDKSIESSFAGTSVEGNIGNGDRFKSPTKDDGEPPKPEQNKESAVDEDGIPYGILSKKPASFFQAIQDAIDNENLEKRCKRNGFSMTPKLGTTDTPDRRIFYGALIADEPWELLEIIAKETHSIFAGMVFVESNRTQSFSPRPFKRKTNQTKKLKEMFGTPQVQIRRYVNEDRGVRDLRREHDQRQEILRGWREMGMTVNDVGYLVDVDETFSRDFLRAIQKCPYVEALDYDNHHCFPAKVKIAGRTRVFESSPECITKGRTWFHPDMIIGACVEEIGNETAHPRAPRVGGFHRAPGFANGCAHDTEENRKKFFGNITGNRFPLWSGGDFRRACGGRTYSVKEENHAGFSAFHMHNFFANFNATRNKYRTYGHPRKGAWTDRLEDIDEDLKMMNRCVQDLTDAPWKDKDAPEKQRYQREVGGFRNAKPPLPIYFMDPDYRKQKHEALVELVKEDELQRQDRLTLKPHEREIERLDQEAREGRRLAYDREKTITVLKQKHGQSK